MTKPRILVTREIPQAGLKQIQDNFIVDLWPEYAPPSKATIIEKCANADGIVSILCDKIDAEVMQAAPRLKIIAQYAVGFDNIDVAEATRRGICVTNTPDALTNASADFAWALLMAVARRVVEADNYARAGKWQVAIHPSMMLGRDVYGATIGIVGAGRIGQAVARRARGFSMNILYFSNSPKPEMEQELGARRVDLDTLLKTSDFVSLHVPLNDKTRNLLDAQKLALMKPTAYLINNARGPVIDENALYEILKARKIAGAALDVFVKEPAAADNPLFSLDNVVVAPHISSASHEARSKMSLMVAANLIAFFAGQQPANLVNTEVLASRPWPVA